MGKYTPEKIKEMLQDIMLKQTGKNLSDKEKEKQHRDFERFTQPRSLELMAEMCNLLESSDKEDEHS